MVEAWGGIAVRTRPVRDDLDAVIAALRDAAAANRLCRKIGPAWGLCKLPYIGEIDFAFRRSRRLIRGSASRRRRAPDHTDWNFRNAPRRTSGVTASMSSAR